MRRLAMCGILAGLAVGQVAFGAQVSIHINIPLPPPIPFPAPPSVVVLPETRVYVVPDLAEEVYFYGGWWWRPWNGRWYRSRWHDHGWGYIASVPSWYRGIPPHWRDSYRERRWGGGPWRWEPIPHDDLVRNWKTWHDSRHWDQPRYRQYDVRHDGRPTGPPRAPERREERRPDYGPPPDLRRIPPGQEHRHEGRPPGQERMPPGQERREHRREDRPQGPERRDRSRDE